METKPAAAVSIIECDMNVDFEVLGKKKALLNFFCNLCCFRHPQGTRSPECRSHSPWKRRNQSWTSLRLSFAKVADLMFSFVVSQMLPEEQGFIAFAGSGNRLDGKKKRTNSETEIQSR